MYIFFVHCLVVYYQISYIYNYLLYLYKNNLLCIYTYNRKHSRKRKNISKKKCGGNKETNQIIKQR